MTLDKKEAEEGGVVTVNCSVPEEKAPVHFTVEKVELDRKSGKQKRKTSQNQNFVTLEFTVEEQDHVIYFLCTASIAFGTNMETSETTKSDLVTVRGQSPALLLLILSDLLVWPGGKEPGIEKGRGLWLDYCS